MNKNKQLWGIEDFARHQLLAARRKATEFLPEGLVTSTESGSKPQQKEKEPRSNRICNPPPLAVQKVALTLSVTSEQR